MNKCYSKALFFIFASSLINSVVKKSLGLFVFGIERICRIVLKKVRSRGYVITRTMTYQVRLLYIVFVGCPHLTKECMTLVQYTGGCRSIPH